MNCKYLLYTKKNRKRIEMAKETKLKEDAFIYQKDTHKSEWQKWKELDKSQKKQYFMDYYFKIILIGVILIALAGYLIYTMFFRHQKETVFYAAVVYDMYNPEQKERIANEFGEYLEINTEDQQISFDDTYYKAEDMGMASMERLMTYIIAGQVDVIITSQEEFERMAQNGNFADLTEQLPTELYSYFEDSMCWTTQKEEDSKKPYGIYLNGSETYKELYGSLENPVIGIVVNSKYKNNANEFLKYLFEI